MKYMFTRYFNELINELMPLQMSVMNYAVVEKVMFEVGTKESLIFTSF